jgi:hypothetical protein
VRLLPQHGDQGLASPEPGQGRGLQREQAEVSAHRGLADCDATGDLVRHDFDAASAIEAEVDGGGIEAASSVDGVSCAVPRA